MKQKYPSNAGIFSGKELAQIQGDLDQRLAKRFNVTNVREEIVSGFLFMKPMDAATRRQVDIYARVLALCEQAGRAALGGNSEQAAKLFALIDEADDLQKEFLALETQPS